MAETWYLSFHGGDDAGEWNNIHRFSLDGKHLGGALDRSTLPAEVVLRELRGFHFGPDGHLYVANAYKDRSQILQFDGQPDKRGKHPFKQVFVERETRNLGLAHPFAVAFGPDGNLYVPSQDTNLVGRYFGPNAATPGGAMPLPASLAHLPSDALLPGTFVPSVEHVPGGLKQVRHAIFCPDHALYVADRTANEVKRYNTDSGELERVYTGPALQTPIHLLMAPSGKDVLVGSRDRNAVLRLNIATGDVSELIAGKHSELQSPSGLAIGPEGDLYVASREGNAVLRYHPDTGAAHHKPFLEHLSDRPEFIQLVTLPS